MQMLPLDGVLIVQPVERELILSLLTKDYVSLPEYMFLFNHFLCNVTLALKSCNCGGNLLEQVEMKSST